MMHKIRAKMGHRDDKYVFDGVVELDDASFKTHNESDDDQPTKRGRGCQEQTTVLPMAKADSKRGRPKKHKKSSAFRYVKMVVIPNSSSATMNQKLSEYATDEVSIKSDGW